MTRWFFFRDDRCPPQINMTRDNDLFEKVTAGKMKGFLRIYNWDQPAVSIGYHQKTFHTAETIDIPIVKRPTGGGAVLHFDDITFSLSSAMEPPFLSSFQETYSRISRLFAHALGACGLNAQFVDHKHQPSDICFATTAPAELVYDQYKIMGCAQRIRSGYFLQQGVIPLRVDPILSRRVFGHRLLDIPRGILSMLPEFSIEVFFQHLERSFGSELNIFFVDGNGNDGQGHHTDQGEVYPR